MDKGHASLFQVYLRLRPAASQNATDRFLSVEEAEDASSPTHITLNPPNDKRRAVEKFGFTQVFEEGATQLDIFHFTGVAHLVEGVINPHGSEGTDALIATLGVTGSGKVCTQPRDFNTRKNTKKAQQLSSHLSISRTRSSGPSPNVG